MKVLQWIHIIPTAIAAWVIVIILGMLTFLFLESLCPPEMMVSGCCMAEWFDPARSILEHFFAGLSALAVVLASTMVAPEKNKLVARIAFIAGTVVVSYMLLVDKSIELSLYSAAIAGGVLGMLLVGPIVSRLYPRPGT